MIGIVWIGDLGCCLIIVEFGLSIAAVAQEV